MVNRVAALNGLSGLVFVSFGLIKILFGYRANAILSETAHYLFSFFEILLGVSFWTKYRKWSFPAAIVFCSGSLLLPFVFSSQGCGCGCFGRAFLLGKRAHLLLSSFLGLFFSMAWFLSEANSRTGRRSQR